MQSVIELHFVPEPLHATEAVDPLEKITTQSCFPPSPSSSVTNDDKPAIEVAAISTEKRELLIFFTFINLDFWVN